MNTKNTLWVKRVVLLNGTPVGKGRPSKNEKKVRTCLYIPLSEDFGSHTRATAEREYNPSKNDSQRKQFKRTNVSTLIAITPATPATDAAEAVSVNQPAEAMTAPAVENTEAVSAE